MPVYFLVSLRLELECWILDEPSENLTVHGTGGLTGSAHEVQRTAFCMRYSVSVTLTSHRDLTASGIVLHHCLTHSPIRPQSGRQA